jgi:protein tyrosine phosphatase (PTP) superfamily phosphohydrolase (DUF442 family)
MHTLLSKGFSLKAFCRSVTRKYKVYQRLECAAPKSANQIKRCIGWATGLQLGSVAALT